MASLQSALTTRNATFTRRSTQFHTVVNRGRSPAILTFVYATLAYPGKHAMPEPIDWRSVTGEPIPMGVDLGGDRVYDRTIDMTVAEYIKADGVYLIGFIRYADIFGNRHITGFCARFNNQRNRFALEGDAATTTQRAKAKPDLHMQSHVRRLGTLSI